MQSQVKIKKQTNKQKLKIRAQINEVQSRKEYTKINKSKIMFCEIIYITGKSVARLKRKNTQKTQITNIKNKKCCISKIIEKLKNNERIL